MSESLHDDCGPGPDCCCEGCCTFDPYEDSDEESYHYRRTCEHCGNVWYSLHCPHDGNHNPCGACGGRYKGRPTPMEMMYRGSYPDPRATTPMDAKYVAAYGFKGDS